MAYTKVTRAHNGKKAINYLFGASHSEGIERNYHITGVNMVSFDSVSPSDQFARYWNRASDRVKVQVIRVTQSFSDKEFDPNNEADILTAHEVGVEAGKQIFGDRQFIVATQIDGKSGYIHNHIFANNINMITNLGMRGDDYQHSRIQQISDDVIKSFGVKLDYGKNKGDKYTQAERAKREKSEYVWKDDLKERIRESIDASSDFDSFEDALAFRGVSVRKGKTITYTLDDTTAYEDFYGEAPKKPFKVRGSKLGYAFDVAEIEKTFLEKNGVQITVPKPIIAPESIQNDVPKDLPLKEEKTLKIDSDASDEDDKIIEIETDILEEETEPEVILPKVEAVDKKQESEEESEQIIEEQEDEEQPTFQFNLSVNTQLDMKQKEGDEKREEAEKKRQRQIRDAQRMTSNLINVDGVDFMDEYKW